MEVLTDMVRVPEEDGRVVLAHGEVTGHHHSFAVSDCVALFREDGSGGGLFLLATGPQTLEHQEHSALTVSGGLHAVVRQRTVSATTAGWSRSVAD